LHIDGHPMEDAAMLRAWVRAAGERGPVPLQVWAIRRPHQGELVVEVTPERVWDKDRYVGRIGAYVGEPPARVWVQAGFIDGVSRAFVRTSEVIGLTLDMVGRMVVGSASLDNLSGPLSMADYAGRSASIGLSAYLSYLALISISLGVLNLMPLPVLDGGHLLYYLYEALTGRPPAAQWLDVLQRLGLLMLVALMFFSLFNDLVRLGWLS
jgi:regulator of sigma E protease